MDYFDHFYPFIKDLLRREEDAEVIMNTALNIDSINPGRQSEAEIILLIEDQFQQLLYGTGYDYNFPGYNAVHRLMNSLKSLNDRSRDIQNSLINAQNIK